MTLLVSGSLLFTGCNQDQFNIQEALPEDKAVEISVPGESGSGQALVGERSAFYETTYNVSRGINGFVFFVLSIARAITNEQPTRKEGNTWTWGPSEPKGLERVQWRFQATKVEEGRFTFKLEGRPKGSSSESDYKVIFDGDVTRGEQNPNRGHGELGIYFDNAQAVEQKSCGNGNRDVLEGTARVKFAADTEPKAISVDFIDFRNRCDGDTVERQPAKYVYEEATDGSGNFQFQAHGNIHKATENKPLIEEMTIRSRWLADGRGRSDVSIGEGEVPADMAAQSIPGNAVTATECWDEMFNVVFQETTPPELPEEFRNSVRPTEGDETQCAFTEEQLPNEV
ncbi:MAG: hypothetical protein AB2A00_23765 [Myxococcota bacterium]